MNIYSDPVNPLFTIGHSSLEIADFLAVLAAHGVRTLCDVRSRPASFRFPQFNREPLESVLVRAGIRYEFFGETLGGRPADPRVYREDGLVDYAARRRAADFIEGIERALAVSRAGVSALMCAEEDPLQCHRFLMICHRHPIFLASLGPGLLFGGAWLTVFEMENRKQQVET
jgi:uncharacterized protein (DUF488 family)